MGFVFSKMLEKFTSEREERERSGEKYDTKKKCQKGNAAKREEGRQAKLEEKACQRKTGKWLSKKHVFVKIQEHNQS